MRICQCIELLALVSFVSAGCAGELPPGGDPDLDGDTPGLSGDEEQQGLNPAAHRGPLSVFVMGNEPAKNTIVTFHRRYRGELTAGAVFPTGGLGTGGGLGSQGALILSADGRWLFAVNAGSDELSTFEVRSDVLVLRDIVSSGGDRPTSLTLHGDLLYVLNAGDPNAAPETSANVTGFRVNDGLLTSIPDSTRPLSQATPNVAPAQVQFSPNGETLVVTERATDRITSYAVRPDGTLGSPVARPSHGQTPFGFAFDPRGTLIVSEAAGGAPGASTVSSYKVAASGASLEVVSGSVPTHQSAACWIAITRDGRFAYTTNTGSDNLSGFAIASDGTLQPLDESGVSATAGDGPIDMDFTNDGRYLYVLNAGDDSLSSLRVKPSGELEALGGVMGLPSSAVGLAAR